MIRYLLSNELEAGARLSDAMLFAALVQHLGDLIEPVDAFRDTSTDRPLWGAERFRVRADRIEDICRAYRDPAVLEALEGRILPKHEVQAEMEHLADLGHGAVLRNMRHPEEHVRYCVRGDRFTQHESAIRSDRTDTPVLVYPNHDLEYVRRFLVVAGKTVTDAPYNHSESRPLALMDPANRLRQAESFMSPFEDRDPMWIEHQRGEAMRLLDRFPMTSGAIDVGLRITADGEVTPHIQEVIAAPPGAFETFCADVDAYARSIAENLVVFDPEMRDPAMEGP